MEEESRQPGAQDEPAKGEPEEGKTSEDSPKAITVVQQNAVIVTGRRAKGGSSRSGKPNSERWL